jgi:hypothetical protein
MFFFFLRLTLFRAMLGDFDCLKLRSFYPVSGPIYFITFTTFGIFILLSTFFAIINNSYSLVKIEFMKMEPEFMLSDYLKINYAKIVEHLNVKKHRLFDMQNTIEKYFKKKEFIDLPSWRTEMLVSRLVVRSCLGPLLLLLLSPIGPVETRLCKRRDRSHIRPVRCRQ